MVRTAMSAGLMVAAIGMAAPDGSTAQEKGVDERLVDGSQIRCVADDKAGSPHSLARRFPTTSFDLDRIGDDEFHAMYRVADDGMTAMVVFSHTVPLFQQIYFPPSVPQPSLTFLRTEPGVYMLFQLDPWDGDTATFSWVERRQREWFTAHGRCEILEE